MSAPFPGMNPYLERPGLWKEVHTRLLVAMADALGSQVRPRYRVGVEQRTYMAVLDPTQDDLIGEPDVLVVSAAGEGRMSMATASPVGTMPLVAELPLPEEVVERYLVVRTVPAGEVITIIELLSHSNKRSRAGREQYEQKRLDILGSQTNLVEIDLLRAGRPFPAYFATGQVESDYRIVVSRSRQRPQADVYLFSMREPLPDIPVPLRPGEPEPTLPLNQLLQDVYRRAAFDLVIDYNTDPVPPLSPADQSWFQTKR